MNNRVAVAISGQGRTLANLLSKEDQYDYKISAVISSSSQCKGNHHAEANNLPLLVKDFSQQRQTAQNLSQWLTEHHIHWIALAGFVKPFPVLAEFEGKIINIHPALLPKFGGKGMYGLNVHKAVLAANEKMSGATIHQVTENYDEGQAISQVTTDISKLDSPEQIADAVFKAECFLYPQTLNYLVSNGRPDNVIQYTY